MAQRLALAAVEQKSSTRAAVPARDTTVRPGVRGERVPSALQPSSAATPPETGAMTVLGMNAVEWADGAASYR